MHTIDQHIGSKIRDRRLQLSISIERLAEELNCAAAVIEAYEAGRTRVSREVLPRLCCVLNVPIHELFEGFANLQSDGEAVTLGDNVIDFVRRRNRRTTCS